MGNIKIRDYAVVNASGISASPCRLPLHSNIVRFPQFQTKCEVTLDILFLGSRQSIREKTIVERAVSLRNNEERSRYYVWRRLAPLDLGYQRDIERRRPTLRKAPCASIRLLIRMRPCAPIPLEAQGKFGTISKTLLHIYWTYFEPTVVITARYIHRLHTVDRAASTRATHIPASGSPLASIGPKNGLRTPNGVSNRSELDKNTVGSQSMPLQALAEGDRTAIFPHSPMSNDENNAFSPKTRQASGFRNSRGSQSRITAMGITPDGLFGLSENEDEFFGDSSVASFLKQIKDSATKEPERGSSTTYPIPRATSGTTSIAMPPVAENGPSVKAYDLPPRQLADYLLNLYFEKIHSLYPYVHKTSFLRAYGRLWMPLAETDAETILSGLGLGDACVSLPLFHCALNIIFALGCHFSKLDQTAREATAEEFFQRSQRLLNMISLDKGDLALVQTLLLTSQYLQGGESPSRCWNIIGLACRIAQSLGMHSLKADRARTPAQIQMRRRVWHGCVMLDLIPRASSMMLGRPPMTHSSAVPLPEAIDDEYLDSSMATCQPSTETLSGTEFYVRTLQLYKILRKILSEVYEPWEDERAPDQSERPKSENELAQTLLSLDEELLAFESNLPVALQWRDAQQPADVAGPFRRESSLLRGRFLHLRILLLRPTLVKFCRNGFPPRQAGGYPRYQQASPAMTSKFSQPVLENAWKSCCDCLENMNPYSNTARNCATNLRKTLSQVLDGQGQESRVLANKPVPQSTGQYLGRDTSLPRAPNYLSTLAGSEVGDDSTQGALDTQFSEALDSLWSGDDMILCLCPANDKSYAVFLITDGARAKYIYPVILSRPPGQHTGLARNPKYKAYVTIIMASNLFYSASYKPNH
ncbi:hypothetical protein M747DRAFT_317233 [Aspergillus niger ATCC 13496]|nr:hypothetical protein M747DRAFT_317233 [Aspergillus niger ATCC 13496]